MKRKGTAETGRTQRFAEKVPSLRSSRLCGVFWLRLDRSLSVSHEIVARRANSLVLVLVVVLVIGNGKSRTRDEDEDERREEAISPDLCVRPASAVFFLFRKSASAATILSDTCRVPLCATTQGTLKTSKMRRLPHVGRGMLPFSAHEIFWSGARQSFPLLPNATWWSASCSFSR